MDLSTTRYQGPRQESWNLGTVPCSMRVHGPKGAECEPAAREEETSACRLWSHAITACHEKEGRAVIICIHRD